VGLGSDEWSGCWRASAPQIVPLWTDIGHPNGPNLSAFVLRPTFLSKVAKCQKVRLIALLRTPVSPSSATLD
jgi:hypothetical protein